MTFAAFMDFAILVLLAATVFIGFKLMMSLRNFRESRFEMEGLLNRLTANIDQAEDAIAGLQNAAKSSGVGLQSIINDSKFLVDELKFMNESGNSLASRLEKLAERTRELTVQGEGAINAGGQQIRYTTLEQQELAEFENELAKLDLEDMADDDILPADFGPIPPLQSQAERELFEALARHKRKSAGGRV